MSLDKAPLLVLQQLSNAPALQKERCTQFLVEERFGYSRAQPPLLGVRSRRNSSRPNSALRQRTRDLPNDAEISLSFGRFGPACSKGDIQPASFNRRTTGFLRGSAAQRRDASAWFPVNSSRYERLSLSRSR